MIAQLDPFKDDNYKFLHRLITVGAQDVKAMEFEMMTHGFLSLYTPLGTGLEEGQKSINIVGDVIA